jgi:hypothetical protein
MPGSFNSCCALVGSSINVLLLSLYTCMCLLFNTCANVVYSCAVLSVYCVFVIVYVLCVFVCYRCVCCILLLLSVCIVSLIVYVCMLYVSVCVVCVSLAVCVYLYVATSLSVCVYSCTVWWLWRIGMFVYTCVVSYS